MRGRTILRLFFSLFGLGMLAALSVAGWLWHDYRNFMQMPLQLPAEGTTLAVPRGMSLQQLAHTLEQQKILARPLYLRVLAYERGDADRIKAGEYALASGLTPESLLDLLVAGKVIEYSLTLVEGWSIGQVLEAIRSQPVIIQTLSADVTGEGVMDALGNPGLHPEGRFFPDTYLFPRGTTDVQILRRAFSRMEEILAEEWEARSEDLPYESAYEALIMASIIEKETGQAGERAEIAGVFVRRLRKGMLLQTDPTVIYGLGDGFDGNIRRRDLERDTPYNTYTRAGLTPTPICMPGRAAIHAALHPADGDALYFVAKGDGAHHFSSTLAEHNRAVRRYQLSKGKP